MGSYDQALMIGYICRLCSELNRDVIHIYSAKGRELQLAEKINLMPISVEPQDSLPKTICRACVVQLDSQYKLIEQLKRSCDRITEEMRLRAERQAPRNSNEPDKDNGSSQTN